MSRMADLSRAHRALRPETLDAAVFELPWAARLFGVTLAAAEAGAFTLAEFQQALIEAVRRHERAGGVIAGEAEYYERWAEALLSLLAARRLAGAEEAVRCAVPDHHHDHDEPPRPEPIARHRGAPARR